MALQGYTVRDGDCRSSDSSSSKGTYVSLQTCADKCSSDKGCVGFVYGIPVTKSCWPQYQSCASPVICNSCWTYEKATGKGYYFLSTLFLPFRLLACQFPLFLAEPIFYRRRSQRSLFLSASDP